MSCKYCEQIEKDGTTANLCVTSGDNLRIYLTAHRAGQYTIEIESNDSNGKEYWDESVPMYFCPFCGKKIK